MGRAREYDVACRVSRLESDPEVSGILVSTLFANRQFHRHFAQAMPVEGSAAVVSQGKVSEPKNGS